MTEHVSGASFEYETEPTGVEIVSKFLCKELPGRAVMNRVLKRVELTRIADMPLLKAGKPAVDETGRQLSINDYLDVAHPEAVKAILGFMLIEEIEPEYPAQLAHMQASISFHAGIELPNTPVN